MKQTERLHLPKKKIKVNQAGFIPAEKKDFLFTTNAKNAEGKIFQVVCESDHRMFEGRLGKAVADRDSGDINYYGDFSSLVEPGTYTIRIGRRASHPFEISDMKYHALFYSAMRSYYLQRCGTRINDPISGVSHAACHWNDGAPVDASLGGQRNTTGGWHDAGDYGKYIPSAAISTALLLLMYELSPADFDRVSLDIPKTQAAEHLSDILAEIKYELDWMLAMQDEGDGAVYHKVSSADFPPIDTAPEDDTAIRYYYGKSTAATADFAAATAIAARVFEIPDPAYAAKLKNAALLAGDFLIQADGRVLEPDYGNTGTYLTNSVKDDIGWAYAELYRLTGKPCYLDMALQYRDDNFTFNISWDNVSFLSVYALLSCPLTPAELCVKWITRVHEQSEVLRTRITSNGYRTALVWDEYVWSSVKTTLTYGVSLILAVKLLRRNDFEDEIKYQLDYVLGVNPLSKVYITKIGTDYVRHPHHRLVKAKRVLVPGLVVGGPNNRAEDGCYPTGLGPRGYVDRTEACSCNEPAIDYNAPFVFVSGYLSMLSQRR
jgi:endoglucanase